MAGNCEDRTRSASAPALGTVEQSGLVGLQLWMKQLDVQKDTTDTGMWPFDLYELNLMTNDHIVTLDTYKQLSPHFF